MLDPIWTSFLAPTGKPLREGDWIKRPNYSKTLERIADEGIEPFYNVSLIFHLLFIEISFNKFLNRVSLVNHSLMHPKNMVVF